MLSPRRATWERDETYKNKIIFFCITLHIILTAPSLSGWESDITAMPFKDRTRCRERQFKKAHYESRTLSTACTCKSIIPSTTPRWGIVCIKCTCWEIGGISVGISFIGRERELMGSVIKNITVLGEPGGYKNLSPGSLWFREPDISSHQSLPQNNALHLSIFLSPSLEKLASPKLNPLHPEYLRYQRIYHFHVTKDFLLVFRWSNSLGESIATHCIFFLPYVIQNVSKVDQPHSTAHQLDSKDSHFHSKFIRNFHSLITSNKYVRFCLFFPFTCSSKEVLKLLNAHQQRKFVFLKLFGQIHNELHLFDRSLVSVSLHRRPRW